MKDGSYCIGINNNDSTSTGNAVIIKLGSFGNILWSKVLDRGGDDGVNSIAEYNDCRSAMMTKGFPYLLNVSAV